MKLFKCKKCGNIIYTINDKCEGITCCGEDVILLKANTVDAAKEKHVPVVKIENNIVDINVGDIDHPMTEEHYITCIFVVNGDEVTRVDLAPNDEPRASFDVVSGTIYAYCNLHGLWKA